ncbi:MAG: 4-hydroxy-3-methylbut-2-enyl diphosphate reductase [Vallitaleaceae bacterium]|jgi:4-hydroxy-3-methylbut-2-enyl diphosphate reductase|nr:4-hydroxy-3-methylbut-2-enyl diphosphate reductase [Vallitaleaceae bacterium]
MEIIVAKTAGFCFGVDRAIKTVYDTISDVPVYTYGPIIHNNQVVQSFKKRDVTIINDLSELSSKHTGKIIIRSHGVSENILKQLELSDLQVIDATCPYVKKIHKIVKTHELAGREVIIIGQEEHPEIIGIKGWTSLPTHVINSMSDIRKLDSNKTYGLVTQTTFNQGLYKEIISELQRLDFHVMIDETICSATHGRQDEALSIAKKVTKMIVIGGKHSSNTQKLYQICKGQCDLTYHIETIDDLELNVFTDNDIIGITAGASTPKNIIEEVILNVGRKNL